MVKRVEALGFDAIEVSGGMWDCLARSEKERCCVIFTTSAFNSSFISSIN